MDNTRKVMMLKYGLEENKNYTEANTLLEPNNFIPSWEDGGEEAREVSQALRTLRADYDEIRQKSLQRQHELDLLRADIQKAREEEKRVSKEFEQMDIPAAEARLDHEKNTHDYFQMDQLTYKYMLDRMKRDLISCTLTINDLTESLRSKKTISEDETDKHMKARELKLQSEYRLHNLMKSLSHDQRKR